MPTKRPDELPDFPEDQDLSFEDILMVEKNPNNSLRKLYKSKLRKLIKDGLRMDPERMGTNAILGMQSKFDWLISQMEKIIDSPLFELEPYSEYNSPSKEQEAPYISPTPTPTPSITPTATPQVTPSSTPIPPGQPRPSPTPTPTPTQTPKAKQIELQVSITGNRPQIVDLPASYLPQNYGYSNWAIKNGSATQNIFSSFSGFRPDSFVSSGAEEKLSALNKVSETQLSIETVLLSEPDELIGDEGYILSSQGMIDGSTLIFTILLF